MDPDLCRHSHILIVALGFLPQNYTEAGTTAQIIARALMNSAVVWLLFFGFTGLFLRYLDRPSPRIRYIVDGSYWVYLIHLPFCAWIPGLLVDTGLPALVKILITLTATTIITFATYNLFVRSTFYWQGAEWQTVSARVAARARRIVSGKGRIVKANFL